MATTTTHCKMGIVDSLGNVNVLYPQTTGADVSITPNSVVSATTVQGLVDSLKGSAFLSNFTGIDDTSTTSTTATYSAKKITALNSDLTTAISGKAASGHTHDDRYYTESEINTKLSGKSDTSHNHSGVYAPVAHASTGTGYGVGNASNYGHVKLSDTYNSNVGNAANAIGASQTALYNAWYNLATTKNPVMIYISGEMTNQTLAGPGHTKYKLMNVGKNVSYTVAMFNVESSTGYCIPTGWYVDSTDGYFYIEISNVGTTTATSIYIHVGLFKW